MANIKHVGRLIATNRKCLVAYRTLPGDAYNCLIVPTENLADDYHDALINLVESPAGQSAVEFAEAMARTQFPDGSTMLPALHVAGKLIKVPTDAVEMIPNSNVKILLSELNQMIADQRAIPVDELAIKSDDSAQTPKKEVPKVEETPKAAVAAKLADEMDETSHLKTVEDLVPIDFETTVQELSAEEKADRYRAAANKLFRVANSYRKIANGLAPSVASKACSARAPKTSTVAAITDILGEC
jgi:hypothetical protein